MLKATAESGERETKGGDRKSKFHDETLIKPKLPEIGIDKLQSHRYQKLAAIPEETFEAALTESAKKRGIENHGCKIKPC